MKERFEKLYGSGGEVFAYHSPGRVNLIGEHTDYNGGYVLPCALTLGTCGIIRKRENRLLRFASTNIGGAYIEIGLDQIEYNREHSWVNYLLGVVAEFQNLGLPVGGLELLLSGDMSSNAGLSSSASVEMLMAAALNELFETKLETIELVKLAQRAENRFVGVNCGIMDQYAVGMGKKDRAMLLDCTSLACEYIPVEPDGHCLIIGNTNSPRNLAGSGYNTRREECERAVKMLRSGHEITLLGQLTPAQFETDKHRITCPTARKRATHVIYEIERTKQAAEHLRAGNLAAFGELMNQSHRSLAGLFEVTGKALDTMVNAAWKQEGVLGSRMTGAGFGGCTVSLVKESCAGAFIENVGKIYKEETGIEAAFYTAGIGEGTRRIG
ncbi:MAG: galactokinase [Oscillospiraceae bacterium]|nr:galactokinase [Oscillospiraceae bacterium]